MTEESRFSDRFFFIHKSGDYLYPKKIESTKTGRLAFHVWKTHKDDYEEVDEDEMVRLVLDEGYAVRMSTHNGKRYGGYRPDGWSIVRVVRKD